MLTKCSFSGYHEKKALRWGFWFKSFCIFVEMALGATDGVMMYTDRPNQGAIIEWVLAFVFSFFALSFCVDFFPSNLECRRFKAKGSIQMLQVQQVEVKAGSSSCSSQLELEYLGPMHGHSGSCV